MCKTNSSAMGYLNIYFNDELKSKHQVSALITRIGRHQDNDVVIDNARRFRQIQWIRTARSNS